MNHISPVRVGSNSPVLPSSSDGYIDNVHCSRVVVFLNAAASPCTPTPRLALVKIYRDAKCVAFELTDVL